MTATPVIRPGRDVAPRTIPTVPSHWLVAAAVRASVAGAGDVSVPPGTTLINAWDSVARALGMTTRELAERIATTLGMTVAAFDGADRHALRLIPEKLARQHRVFPLAEDDHTVTVATADPTDLGAEQAAAFASGRRVVFRLAAPLSIGEAIEAAYAPDRSVERLLSTVDDEIAAAVRVVEDLAPETVAAEETEAAPVVKLTNLIFRDAVLMGASDAHVEPGARGGAVRFRIDGVLRTHMQLPNAALSRVVSRIKVLSKLDIADRMRPQDGRARIEVDRKTYDLRVSTVPTRDAEKAVIRILRPESTRGLAECGLAPRELGRLRQLLGFRDGIVIVTGPTGSGKTTTLYSAIKEIATGDNNVMTVEDPIEYELPGITQMQVEPKRDVTFASALRAILRQDPDVIFVGEIRDGETAQVAAQAALTGHLVLATLHTNDAMGAVARLTDLGLDRPTIAACLRGVVAQRLVRRVCAECATPVTEVTADEARLSAAFGTPAKVRAIGCKACANTGYRGRIPVNEVAIVTPAISDMIAAGATALQLQHAAAVAGMRLLLDVGLERAAAGETTLREVERVIGESREVVPDTAPIDAPVDAPVDALVAAPGDVPGDVPDGLPENAPDGGPAARHSHSERTPARSVPGRVLVVDDDAMVRLLATTALAAGGFITDSVDDGDAALEQLGGADKWDLVVTDLHMPRMGGAELLAALRADPATARLPVVVLTGSGGQASEAEMMDAGADDYLPKPIDPARLVVRVRAALRRSAL